MATLRCVGYQPVLWHDFGIAGVTCLLAAGGGLYWLIPAAVSSLAGGVINAWLFLVRV